MSTTTKTYTIGPSFFSLLALLFIALKLTGVITWSWVWVLAPLWVLPVIFGIVGVIFLVIWGVTQGFYYALTTKKEREADKAMAKVRKTLRSMGR